MSIESRLKRLEAVACQESPDLPKVIISWPDQHPNNPPLKPGWNPDVGVFQLAWPEDLREKPTAQI